MTRDELFTLYGKVQKKDRNAELQLIAEHKKKFPDHYSHRNNDLIPGKSDRYRDNLHMLYLHLTR